MKLSEVVAGLHYKPGWEFKLETIRGEINLNVSTTTLDSYDLSIDDYHTSHLFALPVLPPGDWRRWVFECIMLVEKHEAMEFYMIGGERPYAPIHSRAANRYYDVVERQLP